ncbi:HD domain-containing protein [Kineococcus sp. SYSU DK002]|uniref:HD domain-containing protein n=1 Tax=Kineococcus sp. SYSU DK002 TaxID=3383123 RepID=UPI003D7C37D3
MKPAADTLGLEGTYTDPVWKITVRLSALERHLLRTWWVRRLQFIAHAGAAATVTTQSYSRLEHSLGVLALVAHFHPADQLARAAALVHDIGHLPFSHTFEGLAGLNHHHLGSQRLEALAPVLDLHGLDAVQVDDSAQGASPGPLTAAAGLLSLDHLDSFVRSARSHGRLEEDPRQLLNRLRLLEGAVSTDAATAGQLAALVIAEVRSQTAAVNVLATAVMRHWAGLVLDDAAPHQRAAVAAMTDDEFWALLRADERTAGDVEQFRRNPQQWSVTRQETATPASGVGDSPAGIAHRIERLYLTLPLVEGRNTGCAATTFADLPSPPLHYVIARTPPPAGEQ